MTGYSEGKHDDPADTKDCLVKIGSKYNAPAPSVADGDNTYLLVDAAGRLLIAGSVAHDAVDAGNPVKIGGKANTGSPTAVENADRVDGWFNAYGAHAAFLTDENGTDRAVVRGTDADALTPGAATWSLMTLASGMALAPDGAMDRLRTLGNTAGAGLGVLAAAPWVPGASEITSTYRGGPSTSLTRDTIVTPTSGKKIRIVSIQVSTRGLTTDPIQVQFYFGTGAAYTTTAGKVIGQYAPSTTGNKEQTWPDGGGPVGAADDVLSWRTDTETETSYEATVHYREE